MYAIIQLINYRRYFMSEIRINSRGKGKGSYEGKNYFVSEKHYNYVVQFVDNFLEKDNNYRVKASSVYSKYLSMCNNDSVTPVSRMVFSIILLNLGLEQKRLNDGRYYYGFKLKQE